MNPFVQTPLNEAYKYETHSEFIKQLQQIPNRFSPVCIFCSCKQSVPLNQEGSFRNCRLCNKQFKAKII